MLQRLFLTIFLFLTLCGTAYAIGNGQYTNCIGAGDFGLGGGVTVYANPTDMGPGALINPTPPKLPTYLNQVVTWTASNLYTYGVSSVQTCAFGDSSCNPVRNTLTMNVSGAWAPFTTTLFDTSGTVTLDKLPECVFQACQPPVDPLANDSQCFSGDGLTMNIGGMNRTNVPCKISAGCNKRAGYGSCSSPCNGYGLYGLIALGQGGNGYGDPNHDFDTSNNPPTTSFRTFRVGPLTQGSDGSCSVSIPFTQQCNIDPNNSSNPTDNYICVTDVDQTGAPYVPQGSLYFKIVDTYYLDNSGSYNISITSGVYSGPGLIERTVNAFQSQMQTVSKNMYQNITGTMGFISIVRTLIYLYIVLTGLMFIVGNINITQAELVIRAFKVSILLILISASSFNFFNTYLFSFFSTGAQYIAGIILNATLYYNGDLNSPIFALPKHATALSIYDVILNMLISNALNAKILSLLFTYYCFLIPIFYACLLLLLLGMLRAVMIYLTAIMLVAVLMVIAPVFLVMILFQFTKSLFENWINLLIAAGMMIIAVSALLALLMTILINQIENLFYYEVCWSEIFPIFASSPSWLNFYDFWFWYPYDFGDMQNHMTIGNIIAFIVVSSVFEMVMEQIPAVIDALSKSQLRPVSTMASGAYDRLTSAVRGTAVSARAGLSVGMDAALLSPYDVNQQTGERLARTSVGRAYDKFKESKLGKFAQGVGSVPDMVDSALGPDQMLINQQYEQGFSGTMAQLKAEKAKMEEELAKGKK